MVVALRFEAHQRHQLDAISSVVDLFAGQEGLGRAVTTDLDGVVVGNALTLDRSTLETNLRRVQDRAPAIAEGLRSDLGLDGLDFSVEMETGTGKTYVYLRTIAELHRRYGYTKFVVVVPSVAIREGVLSSLRLLADHLRDLYDGLRLDS